MLRWKYVDSALVREFLWSFTKFFKVFAVLLMMSFASGSESCL
jgi:hypothetical protein